MISSAYMDAQTLVVPAHLVQTFIFAFVAFALLAYFPTLHRRLNLAKLPLFEPETGGKRSKEFWLTSARKVYADGYMKVSKLCPSHAGLTMQTQFKNTAYRIAVWDKREVVVVPGNMLSELRKLPDDVLSANEAASQVWVGLLLIDLEAEVD